MAFIATSFYLSAEPITIRNTSGTELTVEIINLEDEQVTFVRTADDMEFTIPKSLLDEDSQNKILKWEILEKYRPESEPFFNLNGEYIIPIEIQGNTITYFDKNSQKGEVKSTHALKLKGFTERNKKALSQNKKGTLKNIETIRSSPDITLIEENKVTAIFNQGDKQLSLWKSYFSPDEPMLQEISYEIFIPKDISVPEKLIAGFPVKFLKFSSYMDVQRHPDQKIQNTLINQGFIPQFKQTLPATLSSGEWVKNKAIIRTFKYALNAMSFYSIENTPVAIRNIEFKPIEPKDNLLSISDLIEGYNLFHSKFPFTIQEHNGEYVEIKDSSDLYFSLYVDPGYEVEIVIEHENCEIEKYMDNMVKESSEIKIKDRRKGSRKVTEIKYNGSARSQPEITLKKEGKDNIILHRFDVSINKSRDAEKINILHQ
jgi:hypothetical protein